MKQLTLLFSLVIAFNCSAYEPHELIFNLLSQLNLPSPDQMNLPSPGQTIGSFIEKEEWSDAFIAYQKDLPRGYSRQYVEVLHHVGRWDLALEQYRKRFEGTKLYLDDPSGFVKSLVFAGDTTQAIEMAHQLEKHPLPLLEKLKMATLLTLCGEETLGVRLLKATDALNPTESIAKVSLAIIQGNFSRAKSLAKNLPQTPSGLLLKGQLAIHLGDIELGLKLAYSVLDRFPFHPAAFSFVLRYEEDKDALLKLVSQTETEWNKHPVSISWALHLSQALVRYADHVSDQTVALLLYNRAEALLSPWFSSGEELPQLFALLSVLWERLGEPHLATEFAGRALILDPSNWLALTTLAQLQPPREALTTLQTATRYYKADTAFWSQLTTLNRLSGNTFDALHTAKQWTRYSPKSAEAFLALGELYQQVYDPEDALRAYEEAHKLAPRSQHILQALFNVLNDRNLILDAPDPEALAERQREISRTLKSQPKE